MHSTHRRVHRGCDALRDGRRHPGLDELGRPRGRRGVGHGRDRRLARARGLPDLGEVVPHVVGVEDAEDVTDPAPHQVGPGHHGVQHVPAAPVVADEVDRPLDRLQLGDEPVAVLRDGGAPPVRHRCPEPGRSEPQRLVDPELGEPFDQRVPEGGGFRVAVHEYHCHEITQAAPRKRVNDARPTDPATRERVPVGGSCPQSRRARRPSTGVATARCSDAGGRVLAAAQPPPVLAPSRQLRSAIPHPPPERVTDG